MKMLILAPLFLFAATTASPVKSFTQDPATGIYTLVYLDGAGVTQTVQVMPIDRVDVLVKVGVQAATASDYKFSYAVENRGAISGSLAVYSAHVPCPGQISAVSAPRPWLARVVSFRSGVSCRFATETLLAVGQSVAGLTIASPNLPAISTLTFTGDAPILVWPSDEDTPQEAYQLADSVSVPQRGGLLVDSIAPTRSPSELADAGHAIQLVLGDLEKACSLGWVGKLGDEREDVRHEFCNELKEKLAEANKELALGKKKDAGRKLQDFVHELSEKQGERVSESAYALLSTNVNYIITKVLGIVPQKGD